MAYINKNNKLTSFQIITFIMLNAFSISTFALTRRICEISSQDGWISMLIVGIISLINVWIMYGISMSFPDKDIFDINKVLLKSVFGSIINIFYIAYSIYLAGIALRIYIEVMYNIAFKTTPKIIIIILYMILAFYIGRKKIMVVIRFSEIAFYFLIIIMLFMSPQIKRINVDFIFPIAGSGISNILKGAVEASRIFYSLYTLMFIFPKINNQKASKKTIMVGVILATLIYTASYISVITLFGPERLEMLLWPELAYLKTIRLSIFERIDSIVIMIWAIVNCCFIFIQYYFVKTGLQNLTKNKWKNNITDLISILLILLMALLPKNYSQVIKYGNLRPWFTIPANLIIPILLYILIKIKKVN